MAGAAALAPASTSRLRSTSAARILRLCTGKTLKTPNQRFTEFTNSSRLSVFLRFELSPPRPNLALSGWRCFCSGTTGAVSAASVKTEFDEKTTGERVREFRKRLTIVDIKGGADEGLDRLGEYLVVRGWVRTCRVQSTVTFIEVNDGSCLSNMQCVLSPDVEGYDQIDSGLVTTGASVCVEGTLVQSQGAKQKVELKVAKLVTVGTSDPTSFPIQKKRATREFLRTVAHLRPRTNTFGAVARVRNSLAFATHKFFQENGFVWISSPIITASDCEGAGEQFCVTTLIPRARDDTNSPVNSIPSTKDGLVDWSLDFFGKPAFLTVSGQLNAETYATALSDVYTFGPTFRAENSNTSRHLAEFWMIEPELAFADLNDDMACATAYLQYVVRYILENCKEDMDFFNTWIEKGIIDRLTNVAEKDFVQLTYSDAIELLSKAKKKFEFPVIWGSDLQSEHERYITEDAYDGCPVIIRDYPKDIKAFYMRQNDDGKTVAAMDVLVPRVGELIGGSQREERLDFLENRLTELNLNKESYWWYLDLRRYGSGSYKTSLLKSLLGSLRQTQVLRLQLLMQDLSLEIPFGITETNPSLATAIVIVPHAGFGLGFERLVQFATGIDNIRDAIPFPRAPGSAEF